MFQQEVRRPDKVEQYKAEIRSLAELRDRIITLLGQLDGFGKVIEDLKDFRSMAIRMHGAHTWGPWADNVLASLGTFRNCVLQYADCRQEVGRLWNTMSKDEQWELKPPTAFDRERP